MNKKGLLFLLEKVADSGLIESWLHTTPPSDSGKFDATLLDHLSDILSGSSLKVGAVDRDEGTIEIASRSTDAVHELKLRRVR